MATPSKTKALKKDHATSVHSLGVDNEHKPSTVRDVLHLEMVMQRVLLALPLSDMDAFLTVASQTNDAAWLFEDAALWRELLQQHFGGRHDLTADTTEPADAPMEEDDDDDDVEEEDEGDEEEDEREDEEHEADDQNTPPANAASLSPTSTEPHPETKRTAEGGVAPPSLQVNLPKWFASTLACAEATEFLLSATEWQQFQQRVYVIRGDIGSISDVEGCAIDAIAFPGSGILQNPYSGVARVVFARAGRELEEHTRTLRVLLRPGESYVTPGFQTGARVLIHCHGPYSELPDLYPTLAKTYRSVLTHAVQENVACLAMTSISTGNFRLPIPQATRTAMRTIHQFVRAHGAWQGRIGIVCYEVAVFEAFIRERNRVLASFNTA